MLPTQARAHAQLHPHLDLQLASGWFHVARKRNDSRKVGTAIGAMLTYAIHKGLQPDTGVAGAFLGDFFEPGAQDLFEVFTRLQFQY